MLKRIARCLTGHGRLVQEFARRIEEPSHDEVFTDSLSSGESELYALVEGTSAGLGAVSMLKDLRVYY